MEIKCTNRNCQCHKNAKLVQKNRHLAKELEKVLQKTDEQLNKLSKVNIKSAARKA